MSKLDIGSQEFWQLDKVDGELRRVADICSGCRRCLPLCPSFRVLFERIDVEAVDGDVERLPASDLKEVVDLCYQCKLCFNHCPYTPPHRWEVDFPRLMLRARAAEARANGVAREDRLLGNTGLVGRLGSLTAPLSNWLNAWSLHRIFVQAVAGIHKDRNLPRFHRPTFSRWFKAHRRATGVVAAAPKIALFATCPVEFNDPAVGRAAVRVLERKPCRRQPAAPALLRHAVSRRRRHGGSARTHSRERADAGRRRA